MTDLEGLDQSYPPALLAAAPRSVNRMRVRGAPAGAVETGHRAGGADSGSQPASPRLAASPAGYTTPVKATDRPRNLAELAERVQLDDEAPWPHGASLPMGARGKVAHWTGENWKGGVSPGYPARGAAAAVQAPAPPAGPVQVPPVVGGEVSATGPATVQLPVVPPVAPGRHVAPGQSMTTENVDLPR